jgi:transposase-like protein
MSSICIDNRDRNQSKTDVSRIETTRGMIGHLITNGKRIRETSLSKGDHGRRKCQEIQPIRIFGTDKLTMAMVIRDVCPRCKSPKYKKNGHIHNGKQNHQCKDCGRQFVDCFEQDLVSDDTRALVERLLLERLSLRGICRAAGVKLKWLLGFIVTCFEALPDHLNVQPITSNADAMIQRLEVEADEMASFVQNKENKQWIWLAMDAKSRQIIGFHVGIAVARAPGNCGPRFRRPTVDTRHFIRINMWCTQV